MSELVGWLADHLKRRGWSYGELARRSGLTSAAVSVVMRQEQGAGVEFCRRVAEALSEPPEKVFRLAGLLPHKPERDETAEEILYYYDQMTPQSREHLRVIARAFADGSWRGADRVGADSEKAGATGGK